MSTVVKDLGAVSAYAYAVEKGYAGTEAEFAELMADYAEVGQRAEDAAESALNSKTAAQTAATTATNKASEAATAAQTATTKAGEAQTSAQTASTKASEASQSASQASGYAQTAETAKTDAQTAKTQAETARDNAVTAKTAAETAQGKAETAQGAAEDAAQSVSASAAQIATNTADILKAFPTDTAWGAVASFTDGADGIPLKSLVVDINPVQDLSNGDPSPENICPISGWTQVDVEQSGVNIWDEEWEVGGLAYGNTSSTTSMIRSKNYILCKPNTTYYFNRGANNGNMWVFFYDRDKTCLNPSMNGDNVNGAVTTPDKCCYIRFFLSAQTEYQHDVSINYPSTDHDYHPYVGRSIPISWQSEAGTVYGGKLDVLTGILTVTMTLMDLGAHSNWTYDNTSFAYGFFVANSITTKANGSSNIVCTQYKTVHGGRNMLTSNATICPYNTTTSNAICVRDDAYTDVTEFRAAMSGVQMAYELKTPIEIQLSPTEVNSLLGANNIFADTGDVSVEYRADTKLYIEKLTQPEEDDMIADSAITSGQFFMIGNSLYRALANIASGATITVGTNAQRVSLADALNLVNA